MDFIKYPKTLHIEGSKFQLSTCNASIGNKENTSAIQLSKSETIIIEEKMDGSQLGIRFLEEGKLQFQSRGSVLDGGPAEMEFSLAKNWAYKNIEALWELLGTRYIILGEWLYFKHTIFYDPLPDFFMEYDIYDTHKNYFLSTDSRMTMLSKFPFITSVRVITKGQAFSSKEFRSHITKSLFVSKEQKENLLLQAAISGPSTEKALADSDTSGLMEGLYIKTETADRVTGRYKFIRGDFVHKITSSDEHWKHRVPIQNILKIQ